MTIHYKVINRKHGTALNIGQHVLRETPFVDGFAAFTTRGGDFCVRAHRDELREIKAPQTLPDAYGIPRLLPEGIKRIYVHCEEMQGDMVIVEFEGGKKAVIDALHIGDYDCNIFLYAKGQCIDDEDGLCDVIEEMSFDQ